MDKEISTGTNGSTSSGEIVASRAMSAYQMKQAGMPLSEIAEKLGYPSAVDVSHAISSRMATERNYLTSSERESLLTLQVARYETVLSAHWAAMQMADPASSNIVLKALSDLNKVLGLYEVSTTVDKMQVLVIGGSEADYINTLKKAVDG